MQAKRLPNGKLRVPKRAESEDGTIGDGLVDIGPDDPLYEVWDKYLASREDK
jgi:hypothetical protein